MPTDDRTPVPPPGAPDQRRLAWLVVYLLLAGSIINYLDRAVLSVIMPRVRQELSLSNTDYGIAVNAFLMMYMAFYIIGGRLADKIGYRKMFSLTLAFWCIATILHSLSWGLMSLCGFRALLGIGQGGFYPTAMRGLTEQFGVENRAKAVGMFMTGANIGALITPPIASWITIHYGWRAALIVTGASGFVLLPLWSFFLKRVPTTSGERKSVSPGLSTKASKLSAEGEISLGEGLRHPKYIRLLASRAITDTVWYFYLFWIPAYFQAARGLSLGMVGALLWIPYFAAIWGALVGSWMNSALIRYGWTPDRSYKALLGVSGIICAISTVACFVESLSAAVALVSLALFGHMSWISNQHTVISEISPRKHIAVMYGITGAAGTLVGAISQPLIGWIVDSAGYKPIFVGCAGAFIIGMALLFGVGKIEPIHRACESVR